jgi:hypothetical protein
MTLTTFENFLEDVEKERREGGRGGVFSEMGFQCSNLRHKWVSDRVNERGLHYNGREQKTDLEKRLISVDMDQKCFIED